MLKDQKIRQDLSQLVRAQAHTTPQTGSDSLTKRETEVLRLLVSGETTKDIASVLHISAHTVSAHRKNIMRKLNIKTISGLTIYAVLNNILKLEEA